MALNEDDLTEGIEGAEEVVETQPEPKLWAGKYKTPEEMEAAYNEAQRKITETSQRASELEQQMQYSQYNQQQPQTTQQNPNEYWENAWVENPMQTTVQMTQALIQQFEQTSRQARANTKRALSTMKDDPLFGLVRDEFEAELEALDPSVLSNPQQSAFVAEKLYDSVVGKYTRQRQRTVQQDPTKRAQAVRELALEAPQADIAPTSEVEIDGRGKNFMASLGLDKKQMAQLTKDYEAFMQEGE